MDGPVSLRKRARNRRKQMQLHGIHHVTAVTAKIGQNADFYTNFLGLRLVKKSVNQDDVSAYHLFYADKIGSPGTAKNGMSVGATYTDIYADNLADISSWGPTDDGRIKPDVLSPGQAPWSANNDFDVTTDNCDFVSKSGTSMASPGAPCPGREISRRARTNSKCEPRGTRVTPSKFVSRSRPACA